MESLPRACSLSPSNEIAFRLEGFTIRHRARPRSLKLLNCSKISFAGSFVGSRSPTNAVLTLGLGYGNGRIDRVVVLAVQCAFQVICFDKAGSHGSELRRNSEAAVRLHR